MKKAMTSREKYLALLRRNKLKVRGLQIALLVFFIGVWELTTATGGVSPKKVTISLPEANPAPIIVPTTSIVTAKILYILYTIFSRLDLFPRKTKTPRL